MGIFSLMLERNEAKEWIYINPLREMHQIYTLRDLNIYGRGNINVMDVTMMAR